MPGIPSAASPTVGPNVGGPGGRLTLSTRVSATPILAWTTIVTDDFSVDGALHNRATITGGGTWKGGPVSDQSGSTAYGTFATSSGKLVNTLDQFSNYFSLNHSTLAAYGRRVTVDYVVAGNSNCQLYLFGFGTIGIGWGGAGTGSVYVASTEMVTGVGTSGTIQVEWLGSGDYVVRINGSVVLTGNRAQSLPAAATNFMWGVPSTASWDNFVLESLEVPLPPPAAISAGDTGSGTDTASVGVTATDTGSGADVASIGVTGTDTASGANAATLAATLTAADTASGADTGSAAGNSVSGSDTGSGTNTATLAASLTGTDTASAVDSATLAVARTATDTASAADSATASTITNVSASDTATSVQSASVTFPFTPPGGVATLTGDLDALGLGAYSTARAYLIPARTATATIDGQLRIGSLQVTLDAGNAFTVNNLPTGTYRLRVDFFRPTGWRPATWISPAFAFTADADIDTLV